MDLGKIEKLSNELRDAHATITRYISFARANPDAELEDVYDEINQAANDAQDAAEKIAVLTAREDVIGF